VGGARECDPLGEYLRKLLEVARVHHRIARSLDFLASMLKVVVGTPDAGDLERVRFTEWQLTQSNNRQIKINTRIQSRINQLTTTANQICKHVKIPKLTLAIYMTAGYK